MASKGNVVQLSTFLRWELPQGLINVTTGRDGLGREVVERVSCNVCSKYITQLRSDSRIRGKAKQELDTYVKGTNYVSKHNVTRHLSSMGHSIALEYKKLSEPKPRKASYDSGDLGDTSGPPSQPRINTFVQVRAGEAYRKLFRTAYMMAVDGQPMSVFKTLVNVQKANGVSLIHGIDNHHNAREFVQVLSDTIRDKISVLVSSATAISILSDGSQARKTGSEKELVLLRLVKDGTPVCFMAALQDIDSYGDATAENLKKSIDDVFSSKIIVQDAKYMHLVVSATSDGASVNTGVYNGLLTRLKSDRPWLLTIHCISHRLELALKDSLLKIKQFQAVKDFMILIFYMMKQSGKFQRHFKATAEALGVQIYKFPKVHGTRFINHLRRGLRILLHNWIPLAQAIENSIAHNSHQTLNAKLKGILVKLKDVRFLAICSLLKSILSIVANLSLKFQEDNMLMFEVQPEIEDIKSQIQELLDDDSSLFNMIKNNSPGISVLEVPSHSEDGRPDIHIECDLPKPGHMKRDNSNREYTTVKCPSMTGNLKDTVKCVQGLKLSVLPSVKDHIDTRFNSLQHDVYNHMQWADPANWKEDTSEELESLDYLATHFSVTLAASGFDKSKLKREWKSFKQLVHNYYSKVKARHLWKQILLYRKEEFPNITLLVEIIVVVGMSNSVVESCFSLLTSMLSDRRLSLKHITMENLLVIKANHYVWTDQERNEIIDTSLERYMNKRRKLKLDGDPTTSFCQFKLGTKRKRNQNDSSSDITDSDSSSSSALDSDSDQSSVE